MNTANQPMHVAMLANEVDERFRHHNPDPEADEDIARHLCELRRLAVDAVLHLEALKEEVHRLAGPRTHDPRTLGVLRGAAQLINAMRYGN